MHIKKKKKKTGRRADADNFSFCWFSRCPRKMLNLSPWSWVSSVFVALVSLCHKAILMKKKQTFGLVKTTYRDYIAAADIISQHSAEQFVDSVVCFASAVLICGISATGVVPSPGAALT